MAPPTETPTDHACPSVFEFPYELATAAGTALDDLAGGRDAVAQTATSLSGALEGRAFEGATADQFWSSYQSRMEALGWGGISVSSERQRVDTLIADAMNAEADRDAEILACQATHG